MNDLKGIKEVKMDQLRAQMISRLWYLREDCNLFIEAIQSGGPKYSNLDGLRDHLKKYEELVAQLQKE